MGDCWQSPRLGRSKSTLHLILVLISRTQAFKRHAELGYLALSTGLDNVPLPGGIKKEEWDHFHTLVITDEMGRVVHLASNAFGQEPSTNHA